jgi:hypothetical protein
MQPFSLFDFPEDDSEDEMLEMLISQESSSEVDGNGSDRSRLRDQGLEQQDDIEDTD